MVESEGRIHGDKERAMQRRQRQNVIDQEHDRLAEEVWPSAPQQAFFFYGPKRDDQATALHGHPVYVQAPYVRIQIAGERDFISLPAEREHVLKFRQAWDDFQGRGKLKTALMALPTMDCGTARTLSELGLNCVELLADAEIVDRVEGPALVADAGGIEDEFVPDMQESAPAGKLPEHLAKWSRIARQYMQLRQYAETGEKPRVRLESKAA
jgi:hypothetical protein